MKHLDARSASRLLDRITPHGFEYALRKRLDRDLLRQFDASSLTGQEEDHQDLIKGMLIGGRVFGSVKQCGAFIRSRGDDLSEDALALARMWRRSPWLYMVADITSQKDESGFFSLSALGGKPAALSEEASWPDFTLYSPALRSVHAQGYTRILALFWNAGDHWQTYGPMIPLPHFRGEGELNFFSAAASSGHKKPIFIHGGLPERPSLSETIAENPLPWLSLMEISGMPRIANPRFTIGMFASYEKSAEALGDVEEIERAAETIAGILEASGYMAELRYLDDNPRLAPAAYIDIELPHRNGDMSAMYLHKKGFFIKTIARESYDELVSALDGHISLPTEPMRSLDFTVYLETIRRFPELDSLDMLTREFDAQIQEPDFEDDEGNVPEINMSLDTLNAVVGELLDARNNGREADYQEIQKKTGTTTDDINQAMALMERSLEGMGLDEGPGPFDLPPAAVHSLTTEPLFEAEGMLSLSALGELEESVFAEVPVIRLYTALVRLAENGGFIPCTPAGYIKPQIVKALADKMPESTYRGIELQITKEADWYWLSLMRKILTAADILIPEPKGLRLAQANVDPQSLKMLYRDLFTTCMSSYSWEYHPRFDFENEGWIHFSSPLMLYGIKKLSEESENSEVYASDLAPHLARYVPEYREILKQSPQTEVDRIDSPLGYLSFRVVGLFFSQMCIPMGLVTESKSRALKRLPVRPSTILQALVTL